MERNTVSRMMLQSFKTSLAIVMMLLLGGACLATPAKPLAAGKYPARPLKKKSPPTEKKEEGEKKEEKKKFADEKSFNDIVKDMEVIKGLFTFYRKADENKIYLEILPEQFDKLFLFSGSVDRAVGEKGLYSSQMGGYFPFSFRLVGKSVQLVIKNSRFTAAKGTPSERATARSFPDSILASARILSQPHSERKSLLINVSDMLLNDIPGYAQALKDAFKPTDYRFDRSNSSVAEIKAFPENVLVEVFLHFTSDSPRGASLVLADARSVPIVVKYDIAALRDSGYAARYADDRVGHFLTLQQDFTSDRPSSPYVRRIHRWHLEKQDPAAELSPPKKPIVFWLENTIPEEYREHMKAGVLLWNKAFERIGFKDAIVVKQQPDDADWDATDSRYNTIRWFAGVDASFAIGPSRANPFTGEIYDADIGFSEGIIRSVRRMGDEFIGPVLPEGGISVHRPKLAWDREDGHYCDYGHGMAEQAAFATAVLQARGPLTPETEEKLMREYIVQVTAHEVGHTLGLRHNFRASTLLNPEQLFDEKVTGELGQSGSVMDYNPLVIAPKGEKQGHFVPVTLGPYDYWAIEYAYKPFPANETVELAKIAARSSEAQLAYSTDEDALGTYSPSAMDPLVNQFDQSSDPIAYFKKRLTLVDELWSNMERKLVKDGEGYQVLRRAMLRSLNEYHRSLVTASKFIGGLYNHRDHASARARSPYEPIPASKQREALQFLQEHAFQQKAFQLPPTLYNKLAAERLPGLDGLGGLFNASRIDFPWHDSVLNLQRAVLGRLHQPVVLARLQDNELRFLSEGDRFTMADLFGGLEASIWSELEARSDQISSLRRNLQREHLKHLMRIANRTAGAPEDATSLARASLVRIQDKILARLGLGDLKDATTRAHLEETNARIKATLEAQLARSLD